MALALAGIAVELREVDLKHKPQALLDVSPDKSVPVLCVKHNPPMTESLEIMRWALNEYHAPDWLASGDYDVEAYESLLSYTTSQFKIFLDKYKYSVRFPEEDIKNARHKVEEFWIQLDGLIEGNEGFLAGSKASLVDIAIVPFIRQSVFVDEAYFKAQPLEHVQDWLYGWLEHPLFLAVMGKYAPWKDGDAAIVYCPEVVR